MTATDNTAKAVINHMVNFHGLPPQVGFDPATILVIIEIVTEIIKIIKGCKKTAGEVHQIAINPSYLNSWWLRRVIKKHTATRFDGQRNAIYTSLLEVGRGMAGSDLHGLLQEE